ncbi:hypothetical protein SCB29_39490, partial [Paraburkholderia sp. SIMBA_055]
GARGLVLPSFRMELWGLWNKSKHFIINLCVFRSKKDVENLWLALFDHQRLEELKMTITYGKLSSNMKLGEVFFDKMDSVLKDLR